MKIDTLKVLAVYGTGIFVVVFGMFALYQLATRSDLSPEQVASLGVVSIFSGFVGIVLQFFTGSEIAKRATAATSEGFDKGLATPTPPTTTTVTSEGPPATSTTTTVGAPVETEP